MASQNSKVYLEDDEEWDDELAELDIGQAIVEAKASKPQTRAPTKVFDDAELLLALDKYFGHSQFREGQLSVMKAVLGGQDSTVYWATGSGKSLCYQLPAFITGQTVVVVSPLISLMTDQVIAVNSKLGRRLGGEKVATFLGSANPDPEEERKALNGDFRLVYLTPEKLTGGNGFLTGLRGLEATGKLALVAIDEAHCVSQWGHDYREAFLQLSSIREVLPSTPIMALTATAVDRVRQDVETTLGLSNPLRSVSSFDRPNLAIKISRKLGLSSDLLELTKIIRSQGPRASTIVYVPTISETETVVQYLSQHLEGIAVGCYHGKCSFSERDKVHRAFLSGQTPLVIATTAFGMGIDKPDVRTVIHYGAPKTFEEYYQQIGRAGRDGLESQCHMICSENDFTKYSSDFYIGKLPEHAKKATQASTEALRGFANDARSCRRRAILKFFGEVPGYDKCGKCDVCLSGGSSALQDRDFQVHTEIILRALKAAGAQSFKQLWKVITQGRTDWSEIEGGEFARIKTLREKLQAVHRREDVFKELMVSLHSSKYLGRQTTRKEMQGFTRTWEVFSVTDRGKIQLTRPSAVLLPVPQLVARFEAEQEQQTKAKLEELASRGIDVNKIPSGEIENGGGPVMQTHLSWTRTLERYRSSGRESLAQAMEALLERILEWRQQMAVEFSMAPYNVLEDHLAKRIAYSKICEVEALEQIGVRFVRVDDLSKLVSEAIAELFGNSEDGGDEKGDDRDAQYLVFPEEPYKISQSWKHAVFKVNKNGKLPPWKISANRFANGEHPQAIAGTQESGKPIQVDTVIGHILESLLHKGCVVDLNRLIQLVPTTSRITKQDWEKLEVAACNLKVDVVEDEKFVLKELMLEASGRPDKPNEEKSDSEREEDKAWYVKLKWWQQIKRAGVPIQFESAQSPVTKKQRCE